MHFTINIWSLGVQYLDAGILKVLLMT